MKGRNTQRERGEKMHKCGVKGMEEEEDEEKV